MRVYLPKMALECTHRSVVSHAIENDSVSRDRYWGEDVVQLSGSLSLNDLHKLARERSTTRNLHSDPSDVATEMREDGEGLPMVTQRSRGVVHGAVHRQLPEWILAPRLVSSDISADSALLTAVPLPDLVAGNLRDMGCSTLFPIQVTLVSVKYWDFSPRSMCPRSLGLLLDFISQYHKQNIEIYIYTSVKKPRSFRIHFYSPPRRIQVFGLAFI